MAFSAAIALGLYRLQSKANKNWVNDDGAWKRNLDASVDKLSETVTQAHDQVVALAEVVRELAEQNAAAEEERIEADSTVDPEEAGSGETLDAPIKVDDYIQDLQSRGVELDLDNLRWRKKVRCDGDRRGNLGWFVDDDTGKRYFIHRGRQTTVRPAIPRHLLRAWEEDTGRRPCEVELDYQTGAGRGNHAWFLRTYGGKTWRITKGGQGKDTPTVTPLV